MLEQPRPNCPRGIVLFVLELDRNDDVRVHRPQRHAQVVADFFTPAFGLPQRILVADHDRGAHLIDKGLQTVMRIPLQDETDSASVQTVGDIR